MSLNILKPNVNQKFKHYLSNCDLINKYNFKNINHLPKVKKVSLELDLKEFLIASDLSEKNQKHIFSQIKAYLLLYIILGFIPQINYNKNINLKAKMLKGSEPNYSLKLTFSTTKDIDNILHSFFVENLSKLHLDGFTFFQKKEINHKTIELNSFLLHKVL